MNDQRPLYEGFHLLVYPSNNDVESCPDYRQFQFDLACFLLVYPSNNDVESWTELGSTTADAIWRAISAWDSVVDQESWK